MEINQLAIAASINPQLSNVVTQILDGFVVYTDSGHGFLTSGKRSNDGSLRENEVNTAIEDKLCLLCQLHGVEYRQLSPEWDDTSPNERIRREAAFKTEDTARGLIPFGISIHANAYRDVNAKGTEIFHYAGSKYGTLLAESVFDAVLNSYKINGFDIPNRGIKTANFFMIKRTSAPWVLWEVAFMTNEKELRYLKNDSFRNACALALFQGIINYAIAYRKLNNIVIDLT